jgi:hypothetical protein
VVAVETVETAVVETVGKLKQKKLRKLLWRVAFFMPCSQGFHPGFRIY